MFSVNMFVGTPGKVFTPTLVSVSHSTVKICYEPPVNTDKVIKYMTKYRKDGETDWESMPETTNLTETVTGLDEDTFYQIIVVTRYEAGQWGPPSDPIRVKTGRQDTGRPKCCYCV